ncbi:hypothetical protein JOE44_001938 [Chryseobacterium sp. PvR013]|uniref:hypothetical protein n=1 Tax=Chryseobacterium sp. PvR013 TaxID=2806595 RepID=UPI001AEB5D78|nr:hypothetical protein [Chryseobacterium sp. PvR013]MBP1165054.1 hypothetical protein [Chryseobacterium sp. PvR013]
MEKLIYDYIKDIIDAEGRESFPYDEIENMFHFNFKQFQSLAKKARDYDLRARVTKDTIFFFNI